MVAKFVHVGIFILVGAGLCDSAEAAKRLTHAQIVACDRKFSIDVNATDNGWWQPPAPGSCHVQVSNGHTYPDPHCTPGSLNRTVTAAVLGGAGFTTQCIRNQAKGSSEPQKSIVFSWYGMRADSTCEKDHFIPLEIGGADTLDNIWPQCGPTGAKGNARYFKQKDVVETYFGKQVKAGTMNQFDAANAIKSDWTRYVGASVPSVSAKPVAKPRTKKPKGA